MAAEQLGAIEQFTQVEHAQQTGAAEGRIVDCVRTRQRAGVRGRRLCALRHPPRLHDDDRLEARGGARGRHKFARIRDRFDIEQDRAGLVIECEIVEQIGDIDIELVADRNDPRKSDRSFRAPIDHRGRDRAGLRNQGQRPRHGLTRGEARIQRNGGEHHAEAVRPYNPHLAGTRRLLDRFRERARAVSKSGRDDDGPSDAPLARLSDDFRNRSCRRGDDDEIRDKGQRLEIRIRLSPVDLPIPRIDQRDLAGKSPACHVAQDDGPDRRPAQAAADNRDTPWREDSLETKSRHYACSKGTTGGYRQSVDRSIARMTSSRAMMPSKFRP